jgi:hypothetical protein
MCPNEATTKGRCATHGRIEWKATHDPARTKIYQSKEWRSFRAIRLALNPICEVCNEASSVDVHHPVRLSTGGSVFTIEGTECLCKTCHGIETYKEVFGVRTAGQGDRVMNSDRSAGQKAPRNLEHRINEPYRIRVKPF